MLLGGLGLSWSALDRLGRLLGRLGRLLGALGADLSRLGPKSATRAPVNTEFRAISMSTGA